MNPDSATQAGTFRLCPYTIADLAKIYGVTKPTMRKWLTPFKDRMGERNGHYYSVNQVKLIIDALGLPAIITIE